MNIILASASPRRKKILSRLDINFEVKASNFIEPKYNKKESPIEYCRKLSQNKAEYIFNKYPKSLVVGADTIVLLKKNIVLGKPRNKKDAYNKLLSLSDKTHTVITAVTIMCENIVHTFNESTEVTFLKLDESDILKYINTNAPYDKAGGYGIQDYSSIFVKHIKGSYDNVVGFPLSKFNNELKKIYKSL